MVGDNSPTFVSPDNFSYTWRLMDNEQSDTAATSGHIELEGILELFNDHNV